jgi:hypothetical protein
MRGLILNRKDDAPRNRRGGVAGHKSGRGCHAGDVVWRRMRAIRAWSHGEPSALGGLGHDFQPGAPRTHALEIEDHARADHFGPPLQWCCMSQKPEGDWATAPVRRAARHGSVGAVAQSSLWTEPVRGSDGAYPEARPGGAMGKKGVSGWPTDVRLRVGGGGDAQGIMKGASTPALHGKRGERAG